MKVRMEDGRVVEMTHKELSRWLIRSIGEKIVREAGILPTDSDVMRKLKCACWRAVQQSKPQVSLD
jgi:hypothetical protein